MKKIVACALMLILAMLGWVLYANDYQFITERIALEAGGNRLTGTLVLPKLASEKPGVIVFIHGDGPANASRDEGYYSVWETMAKQGYAVLA
ncbi:MAG: alpha/beta hydrolase, partial [Serratia inhibens]|uniref:alpha/beta hydrolase family protein n=1 Tax=Serratia inhibens TaxID=2338073 RepID=UPI003C7B6252